MLFPMRRWSGVVGLLCVLLCLFWLGRRIVRQQSARKGATTHVVDKRPVLEVASKIPISDHGNSATEKAGWPVYGGDAGGQRFSANTQIHRDNVARLALAWSYDTHALDLPSDLNGRSFFEATPVLWQGTLYFDTPFNEVIALDAATGRLRWRFDPKVARSRPAYIVAARGVSLWHAKAPKPGVCGSNRVLVATLDRRLIARDAQTGESCEGFGDHGTVDLTRGVAIGAVDYYFFTSAPTIVGDTVVLGSSIGDNQMVFAASGAVRGFDVLSGKQKWSWEPVRWTAGQAKRLSGSGNAWAPLSADVEHDLVFVPTGSASVDFYGGERLGDNRDADSIVALRASTGEKAWSFQLVHHDIWDYDTPSQPVLFTFRGKIPAVAVVTKTDMVFVFNRLTGEPLYPVVERKVPTSAVKGEQAWPTQPFSTLPWLGPTGYKAEDLHLKDAGDETFCRTWLNRLDNRGLFTPPSTRGTFESPGNAGGANWGSAAFDPEHSVLYTRVTMMPYVVRLVRGGNDGGSLFGQIRHGLKVLLPEWAGGLPPSFGSQFRAPDRGSNAHDEDPMAGAPYAVSRQALVTPRGTPCGPAPFGSIVAMNLDTGEKLWTSSHGSFIPGEDGSPGTSGVIATAGGLLFAGGTYDPYLFAYDSSTGRELWKGVLPGYREGSPAGTPMTYKAGGRQFVVIAVGGKLSGGKESSDKLIAFALPTAN
jgi:quinoprotein glucose dehydrogenase